MDKQAKEAKEMAALERELKGEREFDEKTKSNRGSKARIY